MTTNAHEARHVISTRAGAISLALAAIGFFSAWLLMPGVGITDAELIFEVVGANRGQVMLSVALQLLSAALYAPALVALAIRAHLEGRRALAIGSVVLLAGAMGSAADAVFHWLAVEMTAPGVDRAAMLPVMARMQGPGLVVVAPLIAAFFAGTWLLVWSAARAAWIRRSAVVMVVAGPLYAVAMIVAVPEEARIAALGFLACFALGQLWVAAGLFRRAMEEGSRTTAPAKRSDIGRSEIRHARA
jgi:hypothetical protein